MFGFLKEKIKKIYSSFTSKAASLFSRTTLDESFLEELETLLLSSDVGSTLTKNIMAELRKNISSGSLTTPQDIQQALETILVNLVLDSSSLNKTPRIMLLVGINGSGKTTFAAKYAHMLTQQNKKVLLVAGDTFRAAATQQLNEWGKKIKVPVFIGKENQDPASVIFDACSLFEKEGYDHLIIDTAGRLQTKVNLMKELEKIRSIIEKKLPGQEINTWLTIDAMLGQNSTQQAKLFYEATKVNGLILTKLDGTGKGGALFAISKELQLPLLYITFGETLEDLKEFDRTQYVKELLGTL